MIEITIKMNPQTGEIGYGMTNGVSPTIIIGMIEITKSLIINAQTKPQTQSPILVPNPGLKLT